MSLSDNVHGILSTTKATAFSPARLFQFASLRKILFTILTILNFFKTSAKEPASFSSSSNVSVFPESKAFSIHSTNGPL